MILVGLEPTIPGSVGRCLIHWAKDRDLLVLFPAIVSLVEWALSFRQDSILTDRHCTASKYKSRLHSWPQSFGRPPPPAGDFECFDHEGRQLDPGLCILAVAAVQLSAGGSRKRTPQV